MDEAIIVVFVFVSNTVQNQAVGFKQLTSEPVAGSLLWFAIRPEILS